MNAEEWMAAEVDRLSMERTRLQLQGRGLSDEFENVTARLEDMRRALDDEVF